MVLGREAAPAQKMSSAVAMPVSIVSKQPPDSTTEWANRIGGSLPVLVQRIHESVLQHLILAQCVMGGDQSHDSRTVCRNSRHTL